MVAACSPARTPEPVAAPTEAPVPTAVLKPTAVPEPAMEPQLLLYSGGQDIPTIDPSDRTDYSIGAATRAMYDTFFWEEGFPPELKPMLCTDYDVSDDAKEWTFHLTDKAVYLDLQIVVHRDISPARHDDLNQRHFSPQRWITFESVSERLDPLDNTLCVIEPVYTEYDLSVGQILVYVPGLIGHLLRTRGDIKLLIIDADREITHSELPFSHAQGHDLAFAG